MGGDACSGAAEKGKPDGIEYEYDDVGIEDGCC